MWGVCCACEPNLRPVVHDGAIHPSLYPLSALSVAYVLEYNYSPLSIPIMYENATPPQYCGLPIQ